MDHRQTTHPRRNSQHLPTRHDGGGGYDRSHDPTINRQWSVQAGDNLGRRASTDPIGQPKGNDDTDHIHNMRETHIRPDMGGLRIHHDTSAGDNREDLLKNGMIHFSVRHQSFTLKYIGDQRQCTGQGGKSAPCSMQIFSERSRRDESGRRIVLIIAHQDRPYPVCFIRLTAFRARATCHPHITVNVAAL